MKYADKGEIEVALTAIEKYREGWRSLEPKVIAEICGCSPATIRKIEQRALNKISAMAEAREMLT